MTIKIELSIDDAENLIGLLVGCVGTSNSDEFNAFAEPLIKRLDKRTKAYYEKNKTSFGERNPPKKITI